MPELDYSYDALNVRNAFFRVKTIIYVEGDDDVLFWEEIFSQVTTEKFKVEPLFGSPTLDKYVEQIANGQLEAIAARDSDFLSHMGLRVSNPRVVYSYGHSIENSLYITDSIQHLTKLFCKNSKITLAECETWVNTLAKEIATLVYLDIANMCSNSGLDTIGDNCSRFMKGRTSAMTCPQKIAAHIAQLTPKLPGSAIQIAESVVGNDVLSVISHLRGHFLATMVHRYIVERAKSFGRKVSISSESLYASAMTYFAKSINYKHPHKDHYIRVASAAWAAI